MTKDKCPYCGAPMSKDQIILEVLKMLKLRGLEIKIKEPYIIIPKWKSEEEVWPTNYWNMKSTIQAIYNLLKNGKD